MAIYDIDGNPIQVAYNADGNPLAEAYDADGNPLYESSNQIVVMTYNPQWFTGINGQQAMQNLIVSRNNPHIIGFQEFSKNGSVSTVASNMLTDYSYTQMSSHYNYLYMASKIPMSNIQMADFVNQRGETRAYMKCDIQVDGKTITWINTHLDYQYDSTQYAQMQEIFAIAEQCDYCIITGDFNNWATSIADADYIGLYKPFVDAGYNLANCTAERGFTKTWTDSSIATSPSEMTYPTDNIITSSNISIDSVTFDTTKFSYLNGNSIDHIPIVAQLTVN